jgi:FKBP-type peptidyl-prolyl cis-trans isomerase|mmetsp:Transcript_8160/g.11969  ORF Transcript_8160/g.11969 Transcript_8160/m.11969 type:complete len:294 (+) Transcript_8160:53-934(+)
MFQINFCHSGSLYHLSVASHLVNRKGSFLRKISKNNTVEMFSFPKSSFRRKNLEKKNSISYIQKMNISDFSEENNNKGQDISKDGGVIKTVIKEGAGVTIKDGYEIKLNYQGKLNDGRIFDSSFTRKKPFSFTLGEGKVISGWEIGIKSMKVGEKAKFYISSKYGYKKKGIPPIIPPNADLFFEIEIINAIKPDEKEPVIELNKSIEDFTGSFKSYNIKKNSGAEITSNKFFFISPFSSQSGEKAPWWLNPNITFFLIFLLILFLFVIVYSLGGINQSFENPNSILNSGGLST